MRPRLLLGIVALVPAALNAAPAPAHGLVVPLCSGSGEARSVTLPAGSGEVPGKEVPGKEVPGCCAKACHTGSRKRSQGLSLTPDND